MIVVRTKDAEALLGKIKQEIEQHGGTGKIKTWEYDSTRGFTHTGDNSRWKGKAFFKSEVKKDRIVFSLNVVDVVADEDGLNGIYHGRFVEMLWNHAYTDLDNIRISKQRIVKLGLPLRKTKPLSKAMQALKTAP